ncbi:PBECR2 nuclease fold domain-containing protein, partial [Helicobacter sp. WB40]|uniref:PBECR2 nuclease fold domain-containing protein n=1 Tax=Helicobacter sp. WB40 TaxID=3004130 RepID=UPI0022EBA66E
KEAEEKRIQDEFIKRSKEQTEKIAKMNEQKEKQLDKSIIDKELELQSDIDSIKLKETSINTENDSYKAYFVKVKLDDLKPNFTNTNTQGRTEKKEYTINKIAQEPNFEKFFNSEGSFEGLPIITKDGQIIAGNHRAEALKKLNKENKDKFNKYAKEKFGIDLKDDEIVVRMVDEISNEDILKLSFTSNIGRETNIAELAISTLAKYKDKINKLPNFIESISVEELKSKVAKALDKESNGLDSFNANLALLASLARNKNISFVDSIKAIKGSAEDKERVLKMYVDNAGSIYNVSKNKNTPNIDLREYLTQSVYFTAMTNKSRAENYRELIGDIESVLKTTNNNGTNELINLNPNFYNELISKILGYSFARFKSLENPSRNLYEFLSTSQSELLRINEPTLFNPIGKSLKELDIYDFLSLSVQSGEVSKEASDLIDLLPKLKEKHKAFKDSVAKHDTTNQNLSFKKELEEAWFKEFGPKSIDEDFVPKIPQEIQDKLAFEVKIKASDLEKIVEKGREKYIDKIKPTFETPDYVFRDMQGDILFAKSLDDKLFFVNVTREYDNEILSVTNSPKKTNNIKNKLEKAKEIFYISPELRDSSAHKASTGVLSSTSRDGDAKMLLSEPNSNPTTKDLIKQAKEQGLSAKETKKLIQENKHQQAVSKQNFLTTENYSAVQILREDGFFKDLKKKRF